MHLPHRRAALLFPCFLALFAPLAIGCSPSEEAAPAVPVASAPQYAVGAHVRVNRGGQWLPATIVRIDPGDRYAVHYDGFGAEWVEPVPTDRIAADVASALPHDFRPGERVIVATQQRPMLAEVTQQIGPDQWRVHYDGYGPEVAENVGADRIARPFIGTSAHVAGDTVGVDVNGQVMPAKIAAAIDATRWIVRFDGYGGQYDQVLGADRFRPLPVLPPLPPPKVAEPIASAVPAPPENGKKQRKEKAVATTQDATPAAAPLGPPQPGDAILISQHGSFVPGTIAAVNPGGGLKVKYDAGGAEEELSADHVSRAPPSPKGVHFTPNALVFVEWHGLYVPGKVLKESGKGEYKIRFDGFGPEADEVVLSKRLRPHP